jgi:GNAT superfamily N-acetyltransferase
MPTNIRKYDEITDARPVGQLIAETYRKFNLGFATPQEQEKLLGPFSYALSDDHLHQEAIRRALRAELLLIAVDEDQIVGVLRGKPGRLQSLFVRKDHHRQGIARQLVNRFEREPAIETSRVIHLAATLYAIPFYIALGYKKTTGIRNGWSFEGYGLQYQPMRKVLPDQ